MIYLCSLSFGLGIYCFVAIFTKIKTAELSSFRGRIRGLEVVAYTSPIIWAVFMFSLLKLILK
jgi:hypothetical protein